MTVQNKVLAGLLALSPTQAEDSEVSDPPQTAPATQPSSNEIELPPSIQNRKQEQRVRSKRPRGRPQRDDRALEILDEMIEKGHIDRGLYELFIREKLHLRYAVEHLSPEQIDSVHQADIERLTGPTDS